jgi:hypothetical protein
MTLLKADTAELGVVRKRIARLQATADAIRRLPALDPRITEKVEARVAGLTEVIDIKGIEEGGRFEVVWDKTVMGWPTPSATPLQLEALLRPEGLVEAFVRKAERISRGSVPPSERPARLRVLEGEWTEQEFLEEQLVLAELAGGRPVERRSDASPAAILGVKVVEKPQKRAAA